jgi:serine/threonine protein kinase/tetratricopeptide (TPR) repeat protein
MTEQSLSERSIFEAAVEKRSPEERAAYLDQVCGSNEELRKGVEALLAAHDRLGRVNRGVTVDEPRPGEAPGTVIGPYKLLEPIGEGGMGTVWMAQQTEPVKRLVAVKLIKAGMDSKQVIARFEAERQALALMEHANIARVLDGGATDAGRPYFVMDLVKGVPITRYCDEHHLTPKQRLELFIPVCQAVQHAHQKGIIHRDLKPSNVLVALYDGKPVPKVIDFGVAKAAGQSLTDKTLVTGFGAIVGTLEYMSPEQAELNNQDIDTRSDIYSLGVLLYELLTGTTPLDRARLKQVAFTELLRMIREEEPPKPSTRLSERRDTLPSISAQRQTEPAKLTKLVRGELDWIVMKALEKDRNRRYESANGCAADVQRYLNDEPVLACPPSAGYRLRKFVRRNKGTVAAAAAIAVTLIAGAAVSTWQAVLATRAAESEHQAKEAAQKRLEQTDKSNEILTTVFADLDMNEVRQGTEPLEAVLAHRLVKAASELEGEAVGEPLVVARLQDRLGKSLLSLGFAPDAIPLFKKARETRESQLGHDPPDTLRSMSHLAWGYLDAGMLDLAVPLFQETLELQRAKLGDDHYDTISTMGNLALAYHKAGKLDLAVALYEETVRLEKAMPDPNDRDLNTHMHNLATGYQSLGKLELALPLFEETLERDRAKLGPDHRLTLSTMNALASAYQRAGKRELAVKGFEEVYKLTKAKLGAEHPETIGSMNNLAHGYGDSGREDLAKPLFEQALKLCRAKLGPDHPHTLLTMTNLATTHEVAGKHELAIPLYEETLKLMRAKNGDDHPDTAVCMRNLAWSYLRNGQPDRALPLFQEAVAAMERRQFRHEYAAKFVTDLIGIYERLQQFDQAESWRRKLLAVTKERSGPNSLTYAGELANLGTNLLHQKKWADADAVIRDCLAIREKQQPDAWNTFSAQSMLGEVLLGQQKYADAEPLLLAGYEGLKQRAARVPPQAKVRLTEAVRRLVQLYEATGQKDKANEWRKELQGTTEKK